MSSWSETTEKKTMQWPYSNVASLGAKRARVRVSPRSAHSRNDLRLVVQASAAVHGSSRGNWPLCVSTGFERILHMMQRSWSRVVVTMARWAGAALHVEACQHTHVVYSFLVSSGPLLSSAHVLADDSTQLPLYGEDWIAVEPLVALWTAGRRYTRGSTGSLVTSCSHTTPEGICEGPPGIQRCPLPPPAGYVHLAAFARMLVVVGGLPRLRAQTWVRGAGVQAVL